MTEDDKFEMILVPSDKVLETFQTINQKEELAQEAQRQQQDEFRRRQSAKSENVRQSLLGQITGLGFGGLCRFDAFTEQSIQSLQSVQIIEVKNLKEKIKELENYLEFQNKLILDLLNQKNKE